MKRFNPSLVNVLSLALSLGFCFSTGQAQATKLNATPLPRDRAEKDFSDSSEVAPQLSRFQRRPDYREAEAQKQQAEEAARVKAQQDAKAIQDAQIEDYKQRQKLAIEANRKGVLLGKQGHWAEAIEAHESAVRLDPQTKQLRINLSAARTAYGQQRMAAGDVTGAASLFRKALSAASDNGLAGRLLVEAMKRQGRDPLSAEVRMATGDQLAAVGDLEGALVEYQAGLQLESSARAFMKMGDVALRFGQASTAANWYRQAIVKDPDFGPAHRQLGLLAVSQRDYTSACASLRKAVILDPKDAAAGQTLVEIWRHQVASNPLLAENHLGLAGALQLTGDFAGADIEYRKLEALDPKNPGLAAGRSSLAHSIQHARALKHSLAAETLFNQGLRREALSEISQAVMAEPRNSRFQFLLGECLEANGDYQGAHQAYLTCVLIDPENNKEAAARMKEMQNGLKNRGIMVSQAQTQTASPANKVASPASLAGRDALPRKDMFEGGPGMQSPMAAGNLGFRTHDESETVSSSAAASSQMSNQISRKTEPTATAAVDPAINTAFDQVSELELKKDYTQAISVLRPLLSRNLQNSDVHHRLAVDLLSTGQISEAIAEFRIASALSPSKKSYADDLAQALVINKNSLQASSTSISANDPAGATK